MTKKSIIRAYLSQGRSDGEVTYMLRSCDQDLTSYGGFKWPSKGPVEAPDWDPSRSCGNGLHGLLMGRGDIFQTSSSYLAKWLVCAIWSTDMVELAGKVKVPRAWVIFSGRRENAVKKLQSKGAIGVPWSTVTTGSYGTSVTGDYGTAVTGDYGTAVAGASGSAVVGRQGVAVSGYGGTSTAGYRGTATSGDYGTAMAGDYGTAMAGLHGTVTAGHNGIKPNVAYCLGHEGNFVEKK